VSDDLTLLVRRADPVPTADSIADAEFEAALVAIEIAFAERAKRRRFAPFFLRLRRRPAFVFVGAMAVTALVVALPILLLSTRGGEVTESTAATTTSVAPTTTAAPTTSMAPPTTAAPVTTASSTTTTTLPPTTVVPPVPTPEISWRRLPSPPAFENALIGDWMARFVRGGPGLVGFGYVYDEGEEDRPYGVVFVSADGEAWQRIDPPFLEEYIPWAAEAGPTDIAVGPGGRLVIVGGDGDDAAVWVSDDGYAWDRVRSEAFVGPDQQMMFGVVAGGPGFVATGGDPQGTGVWLSPDGYEWSRVEDEGLLSADIFDVAVGDSGLVAIGVDSAGGAAWLSDDGSEWERVAVDAFATDSSGMMSLTTDPFTGRLFSFGSEIWTSLDGRDWVEQEREPPFGAPPPGARTAWSGDVGIAAGFARWFEMYVTGDGGDTWTRVEPDGITFEDRDQSVAAMWLEDRWVIVGSGFTDGGVVWIGTPLE